MIHQGYPAIKLKKFFVTDDSWSSLDDAYRSRLSPSFSTAIYKRMNHDLNHLGDPDLEDHFATSGKNEARIYSKLPLITKDWLKEELVKSRDDEKSGEGLSTIDILDDYLGALNRGLSNAK